MNLNHVERRLRLKEHELLSRLVELERERSAVGGSNEDEQIVVLTQVRDALHRLREDKYGKCVLCDGAIDKERLQAMPWTPYCSDDQRKFDLKKDVGKEQSDGLARQQSA